MLYVLDRAVKQYESEVSLTEFSPKLLPYEELIGVMEKIVIIKRKEQIPINNMITIKC